MDNDGLSATIKCCSGVLNVEKLELRKYLKDHLEDIDSSWTDDLSRMRSIFGQDEDSDDDFSLDLSRLIPQPLPTDLLQVWDWDLVYSWLRTDYMPYYFWCSLTHKVASTERYVGQFEEWLQKFYRFARSNDAFAPNAVRNLIRPMLNNACVLVIIIDALSWEDAVSFRKLLAAQGMKSSRFTGHICALPSETKIAKPAVVLGKPVIGDQSTGLEIYHEMLSENLGLDLDEIAASTSSIMPLSGLITGKEKKVYLYLYNEVDKIIHEPKSIEMRRNAVESYLKEFAEAIGHAVSEYEGIYRRKLATIISSDHGYTELPQNSKIVEPPDKCVDAPHFRNAVYRAKTDLPDDFIGFFEEGEEVYYAFPKGYSCIGKRPQGAIHGGVTPQEVLVPVLLSYEPESQYTPVKISISGTVRRGYFDNEIDVSISNPNATVVTISTIEMNYVTITTKLPIDIAPGLICQLKAKMDGNNINRKSVEVNGRIVVDFGGENRISEATVQVDTVGAAVTDTTFEDEFDV